MGGPGSEGRARAPGALLVWEGAPWQGAQSTNRHGVGLCLARDSLSGAVLHCTNKSSCYGICTGHSGINNTQVKQK